MHYDIVLKSLLRSSSMLRLLTGSEVIDWRNVEIPKPRLPRVDLLVDMADGYLHHFELQSNPEPMLIRMYLYSGAILADTGKLPIQHVLYVGNRSWSETTSMQGPDVSYRYRLTDLRDFEAGPLLESDQVDDNLLALLCRLKDRHEAVRRVVRRIAQLPRAAQIERQAQLMVLSGLRDLSAIIEEEMSRMPITADIRENYFARKYYKEGADEGRVQGREEGRLEGREEGRAEGTQAGAAAMLAIALEQRFGSPPQWVRDRIATADRATLERWMRASFHAATLEEAVS